MNATKLPPASPRSPLPRNDDVRDVVRRRSLSLHARTHVAGAIRELALDICGGEEALSAADRASLRQLISSPVNEATEEALRVLVDELTAALHAAPPKRRPAFIAPIVSRTDFE